MSLTPVVLFGRSALDAWKEAALCEARFLRERNERWGRGDFSQDELPQNCASAIRGRTRCMVHEGAVTAIDSHALLRAADLCSISTPVHVLVTRRTARVRRGVTNAHLHCASLGKPFFFKLRNDVFIPMPELALCQVAETADLVDLLSLSYELAGIYSFDPESGGLLFRPSLLTGDSLRKIASSLGRMRGACKIQFVVSQLSNRSRSPRESSVSMLLSLPYRLGGYKLPVPSLNLSVPLNATARSIYGNASLECDLCWMDKKVAVFYESDAHHLSSQQLARDARRDAALVANGFTVVRLSNRQLKDVDQMDAWAKALASRLGKSIRPSLEDYYFRKQKLRRQLRI